MNSLEELAEVVRLFRQSVWFFLVQRVPQRLYLSLKVGLSWRWNWCCYGNTTCTSSTWRLPRGLWTPQRGRPGWRSRWREATTFCTTSAAPRGNPSPARTARRSSDASGIHFKGAKTENLSLPPLCWTQQFIGKRVTKFGCQSITRMQRLLFQYQPNRPDVGAPSVF